MIVSWNWLTEYIRLDMTAEALAERLALAGLNHESTEEVAGDLAIDLEITSNRPDCLCHIGVAREIAVLYGEDLKVSDPRPIESGEPVASILKVTNDAPSLCPTFTARVVRGVTIGESPWWLRKRLETLGVRPVNNVVDITNYVMYECGQSLHAYDLDKLAEQRLVVRPAAKGEKLVAINGKTYELDPEMLVIADAERPVGLAGVMGGLDTEIGPDTKNLLIESARFDPVSVRRTSRALGLFSPSSYRFERGMDPERTDWASRRAAELILELAGGTLHPGVVAVGSSPAPKPPVTLRPEQIGRILGIAIAPERAIAILEALGLEHRGDLAFVAPSWRSDLEREIDLIEEVARIHGYEHIPENRPVPLTRSAKGERERVEGVIREALIGAGFDEAATFSLIPEELVVPLQTTDPQPPIRVEHSTRKRETILRPSLVPSLLAVRASNEAHGTPDASLYEMAHVYLAKSGQTLPDEPTRLGIVGGLDFLGMKGLVDAIVARLHIADELKASPTDHPLFTPGRAAHLLLGDAHLGYIGEIARERLDDFELRGACSAAELEFEPLLTKAVLVPKARPLPSQPAIARDLSLVVPLDLPWSELADVAKSAAGPHLEGVNFLDTFRGNNIPEGRHSLHFGLRFRHRDRTLTGEEVDRSVQDVVDACVTRFGATQR